MVRVSATALPFAGEGSTSTAAAAPLLAAPSSLLVDFSPTQPSSSAAGALLGAVSAAGAAASGLESEAAAGAGVEPPQAEAKVASISNEQSVERERATRIAPDTSLLARAVARV